MSTGVSLRAHAVNVIKEERCNHPLMYLLHEAILGEEVVGIIIDDLPATSSTTKHFRTTR